MNRYWWIAIAVIVGALIGGSWLARQYVIQQLPPQQELEKAGSVK